MAVTNGGLLVDPDSLDYELAGYTDTTTKEVVLDTATKRIKLTRVGNLTADGVTLKCLYSKLKELWKSDATLIKFPFAMTPITDEQFEFVNGWFLDDSVNTTTDITVAGASGTSTEFTITTSNNFNTSNVVPGMYVSGTGVGTGARVVAVNSNTQITVSVANSGTVSGTLTFWVDVDYTYNLIRTGGWRRAEGTSVYEEWIGAISLGNLGAEQTTKTLVTTAGTTSSAVITVGSTTGVQVGSFVTAPGVPYGTTVSTVDSSTQITMSKTGTFTSGAIVTIRPKDQIYYQLGDDLTVTPRNAVLTGQVNQAIKVYGAAAYGNFDYRGTVGTPKVLKFYVREQGYTYGAQTKQDIGVIALTYQTYRFPVTNSTDLKIVRTDSQIDTAGASNGIPNQSPYNKMTITWYAAAQTRTLGASNYNFNVIIDADTDVGPTASGDATLEQVYEFVQWSLRRPVGVDIDQSESTSKVGAITRELVRFVGDTLETIYDSTEGGVFIDSIAAADKNRIKFADNTGVLRTYPFTAAGKLTFNPNLSDDAASAVFRLFYKQINTANSSTSFGSTNAVLVKAATTDLSGDASLDIKGNLTGATPGATTEKPYDFDYDGNNQTQWKASNQYVIGDEYWNNNGSVTTWYRVTTAYTSGATFGGTDTSNSTTIDGPSVILVAIGLNSAQYVSAQGTIAKSISNTLGAVAALERNYDNPV